MDEAYSLCKDSHDSFGKEAIDTLVDQIEKISDLMVILGILNKLG
ncbi:MAG: hypothetical protein HQK49_18520 [Oligoflexia bacterium]|nr:hypothetical protein [Oligoflexia bacterium]